MLPILRYREILIGWNLEYKMKNNQSVAGSREASEAVLSRLVWRKSI